MKKNNIFPSAAIAAWILVVMMTGIPASAQIETKGGDAPNQIESKVTIRDNQTIQFTVEGSSKYNLITIVNPTDLYGDVDFVANDEDGKVLDQGAVEFGPNVKTAVSLQEALPDSKLAEVTSISVQISLRQRPVYATEAVSNPIAFFSQRDSAWKDKKMGTSGLTIGGYGCAMTSVTMASAYKMRNSTPLTLNTWLSANSGYTSNGSLYWGKPPGFDASSGFKYIGSSFNGISTVKSAANLKSLIDGGYYVVVYSYRFTTRTSSRQHWTVIYKYHGTGSSLSDFEYLDPWDLAYTYRTVNDGKVVMGSAVRIYK